MKALRALLAALVLVGATSTAQASTKKVHHPKKIHHTLPITQAPRHYLGWTRTTQYIDCCVTASGYHVYYGEVAADPSIPFGATVVIPGLGYFTVRDRGGAVYGSHVDIWVPYFPYHGIRDYYAGVYWIRALG